MVILPKTQHFENIMQNKIEIPNDRIMFEYCIPSNYSAAQIIAPACTLILFLLQLSAKYKLELFFSGA